MPAFLSVMNPEHDSPRAAIFYHVVLAMLFAMVGQTDVLINYLAFAMWVQRTLTMCALIYIRVKHVPVHPDRIRVPLVIPVLFLIICATLVCVTIASDVKTASVGLAFLVAGFSFYVIFMWNQMLPRFESYRNACAKVNGKNKVGEETRISIFLF